MAERFEPFLLGVRRRLEQGKVDYGESMYSQPSASIIREAEEELFDIVAWVAPLYERLQSLRMLIHRAESELAYIEEKKRKRDV